MQRKQHVAKALPGLGQLRGGSGHREGREGPLVQARALVALSAVLRVPVLNTFRPCPAQAKL